MELIDSSMNGKTDKPKERHIEKNDRKYQDDLYKEAKDRNIIVCLGTGTGKTFIAVLLIKDSKFQQQLNGKYSENAKRTIFLVPTRPLVRQQAEAIKRHIHRSVGKYTGDLNVDDWDQNKWDEELETNQILVMTAQIFLDMLNRGFIKFEKVNLLIMDEVHWAAKTKAKKETGHAYKQIMNSYDSEPERNRPRVLGLTASIINCTIDPGFFDNAIKDLEKTCDSVCLTSRSAQLYATNPTEIVLEYNHECSAIEGNVKLVSDSLDALSDYFKQIKKDKENKKVSLGFETISKCLTNVQNLLPNSKESATMSWMGIWCANVAIDIYIEEFELYHKIYSRPNPIKAKVFQHIKCLLTHIKSKLKPELNDPNCVYNTASPKMHRMLKLLMEYKPKDNEKSKLCGIIFVNQRSVAKVLTEWLNALKEWKPFEFGFMNVGYVVGHSTRPGIESTIASFSDRKQHETIEMFREEKLNLLVATSVLEEGLDVRQCNLVVRFDKPKTFREYLQSKGRARAVGAFYYILTPIKEIDKLKKNLKTYGQFEEKIKNLNHKHYIDSENSDDCENDSSDEEEEHINHTTGAKLTTREAVRTLYRYCQKLPSDSFTKFVPTFEEKDSNEKFVFSVKLPINCPIKETIDGKRRRKKNSAKRNAAFQACMQLIEFKELDHRFLPVSREQSIDKYVEDLGFNRHLVEDSDVYEKTGTKNIKRNYEKKWAQVFNCNVKSNTYYLHRISLQYELVDNLNSSPMSFGVITSVPIINICSFPVFVKSGKVEVKFVPLVPIKIDAQQKSLIQKFHSFTFSQVLRIENDQIQFNSSETKFFLFIVPINNESEINWNFIELINKQNKIIVKSLSLSERREFTFDSQLYKDCVFYRWYKNEEIPQFYNVVEITANTPNSAFQGNKKYKTFEDFYLEKHGLEIFNKNQFLIEGKLVENFAQLNTFQIKKKAQKMMNKTQHFVPELVAIHPFPDSLWRQALCLPAILYRLNCLLLAEELRKSINLETSNRISNPLNSDLNLDIFEKLNKSKQMQNSMDCDDNCNDISDEPPNKKTCNDFAFPQKEEDSEESKENLSSDSNNCMTSSSETLSLSDFVETLINQFNLLLSDAKTSSVTHQNNDIVLESEYDSDKIKEMIENKPPSYGEAFPFWFEGEIDEKELIKYDSTPNDVMSGATAAQLLNALTLVNANDCFNLERLETIGDSFLKFVTTTYLYFKCNELDEGKLTELRKIQICNRNLYHIGINKGIQQLIVATKFEPKLNWLPPSYKTSEKNERSQHSVSDKSIADSIEALIGAHLLSGGNESAITFMQWLGLKAMPKQSSNISLQSPILKHLTDEEIRRGLKVLYDDCYLSKFEQIIGYQFNNKAYLVQALTHSSYYDNRITDCYQRLEILGDSVLDYLITRHIFKDSNKFSPGDITDLRSALVNNTFFASIAVKFNFHKYLKYMSFDLFQAIDYFEVKFEDDKSQFIKNCFMIVNDEEVTDSEEVEVPKALGDIFESVAGAIYLDNGLSLDSLWNVYYRMLKPEIDYFSKYIPKMPVRELREKVPKVEFSKTEITTDGKIQVVVTFDGKCFTGIGKSKKLAKIAASKSALKFIKSTKNN